VLCKGGLHAFIFWIESRKDGILTQKPSLQVLYYDEATLESIAQGGSKKRLKESPTFPWFLHNYQTVTKVRSAAVARAAELTSQEMGHS